MNDQYQIQKGDTLGGIASTYGTDLKTLQSLNPSITDVNKILAGATIKVPPKQSAEALPPAPAVAAPGAPQTQSSQPAAPTPSPLTGSEFGSILDTITNKSKNDNSLINTRNLMMTALYNRPLTGAEQAQLSPDILKALQSGDRSALDMEFRIINDQIKGNSGSLDSAVKYIVQGYNDTLANAEKQKTEADNVIKTAITDYGSQAKQALTKLYGPERVAQLEKMTGVDLAHAQNLPATLAEKRLEQAQQKINISVNSAGVNDSYKAARAASSYASAIKTTISDFYPPGKSPLQAYGASAQAINRIDTSLDQAKDPTNPNKGAADLDLVDAYVQIARGGQAITEAQVQTLLSSLGIKATFDVVGQKITGSAILDDGTRDSVAKLSHQIYTNQGKVAQKATDSINKQLTKQGIPEEYLLNSPEDALSAVGDTSDTSSTDTGNDPLGLGL